MSATAEDQIQRKEIAAGCPWCGDGTKLILRGDGYGGMSLWCSQCGCKGPTVRVENDFSGADAAAVERWSSRAGLRTGLPREIVDRISRSVVLASILGATSASDTAGVSLEIRDIRALMKIAVPDWRLDFATETHADLVEGAH